MFILSKFTCHFISASKYFKQISLSFYSCPNIPDKFLSQKWNSPMSKFSLQLLHSAMANAKLAWKMWMQVLDRFKRRQNYHLFLLWQDLTPLGGKCEEENEDGNLESTHFAISARQSFNVNVFWQVWTKQSGCSKLTEWILFFTRPDRLRSLQFKGCLICFHTHCYTFIAWMIYVDMQ